MPARQDLPSTLRRSSPKAQETWIKTHDSAVGEYGEGQRSHRVAFAALKHSFEKVGDRWEEKGRKGPSDAQATRTIRDKPVPTASGVDANAPKEHLMDLARRLDIKGRSGMTKDKLVQAIQKANTRTTANARATNAGTTAAKKATGAKKSTGVKKTTAAKKTTGAKKTTAAKRTTAAKKTTPAQKTTAAKKTTAARKSTGARTATGARKATGTRKATGARPARRSGAR